jgi:hypothetical protein
MVHGDYFGINYIIHLTKPIDLFNDLLPICTSNRHMLTLINPTKISIFTPTRFDKRLHSKEMSSFISALYELNHNCYAKTNYIRTRQLFPDLFLYYDVLLYSTTIKGRSFEIITNDELNIIKTRYNELEIMLNNDTCNYGTNEYKLCFDELKLLRKTIEIQTIICDKEYLQKIIDIEEKITNISLTDEEAMLIKSVESHPTINNFIETSGFEMIKECY